MKVQADDIIKKISEIRSFTDDSYLKTTHYAIFLLFGCLDEMKVTLEQRAREIIVDKKAISFLTVENAAGVAQDVKSAIDEVSRSGVDLQNLTELHFCPIIVSDMAAPALYGEVVDVLETYKQNNDLLTIWKPFIILNTEEHSTIEWLNVISLKMKELSDNGAANCCRCCIMTRKDEDFFAVTDERLLNTVLFVSLLHANDTTREGIGRCIAYRREYPEEFYYTAQTVFISNPVIMRTLHCIRMLLDRIDEEGGTEQELDLTFTGEILEPLYARLPNEGEQVTFVPLLGVMPEPNGSMDGFMSRLKEFAKTHYLSQFDINKADIFLRFRKGFLRSFIESGMNVEFLHGIIGNDNEIKKLSRTTVAVQMSSLPAFTRKSGISSENLDLYAIIESKLRSKLNSLGSELVEEFLRSEEFISLPALYNDARKLLRDVSNELVEEVDRRNRSGVEIYLDLLGEPDEQLVFNVAKELSSQSIFSQFISDITLAMERSDEDGVNEALGDLLESLYNSVRGLSGGSGARDYMNLLSRTCQNPSDNVVKHCIQKISSQLKFPMRFNNKTGRKKCTFMWGSQDNNFYSAWERQQTISNTDNEFLPIPSKERFVILSVSPAFTMKDIRGITGAAQTQQEPEEPQIYEIPPESIPKPAEEPELPRKPIEKSAPPPEPDEWSIPDSQPTQPLEDIENPWE
ncbi:MAG: hypothetical protein FWE27_03530 [Defluviitaleaceae bacterium]|nr:hypothetical protein [Defluviitaleaceae bacterium]